MEPPGLRGGCTPSGLGIESGGRFWRVWYNFGRAVKRLIGREHGRGEARRAAVSWKL
jgi:hypothetical protein